MYYQSLGEYLNVLEEHDLLVRVARSIDKDTELQPLVRLQFRGLPTSGRKAFLFENVVDGRGTRYEMPVVVGCYAGNRDIYALGMQCRPDEIFSRWQKAFTEPVDPVAASHGPVQEVVIWREELQSRGLQRFPVPISTPGFDTAPYLTAANWVSRDPDSGIVNVGNYRGQIKAPDRLGCYCTPAAGMVRHWKKQQARGEPLQVACVLGVTPNLAYTSVARVPIDVDEYAVAGAIAGSPLELVPCKTVDLSVPANAECVIEGLVSTEQVEREGPFGEFTGFMVDQTMSYFVDVTCITMRRNPLYAGFISQFPPSESSILRGVAREGLTREVLRKGGFHVKDLAVLETSGSWGVMVISIKKSSPDDAKRIGRLLCANGHTGKVLIVVDEDVDVRDPHAVLWAVSFRMQVGRGMEVLDCGEMPLDPSLGHSDETRSSAGEGRRGIAKLLFLDATLPWDYAPISLPSREIMTHAVEIWGDLGLPELKLQEPWYGYELGFWPDNVRKEAERALRGDYFEIGREMLRDRKPAR